MKLTVHKVTNLDLSTLQDLLGGRLECFGLMRPDGLSAYCDEEGRSKYASNGVSEMVRSKLSTLFGRRSPSVVGPILVTNMDEEGETIGLTECQLESLRLLFKNQ